MLVQDMIIAPMLAATVKDKNYKKLFDGKRKWYVSGKIDGIRGLSINGIPQSRSGKIHRNLQIQEMFKELPTDVLFDGELLSCDIVPDITFSNYTENIMSIKGLIPKLKFYIFDVIDITLSAKDRYNKLLSYKHKLPSWCVIVEKHEITTIEELTDWKMKYLELGYEGVMLQSTISLYRFKRCTIKEAGSIKVKDFSDSEAEIIGYNRLKKNNNESLKNELGFSEKSSAKDGIEYLDAIGSFECKVKGSDQTFSVGSGLTLKQRYEFYKDRENMIGKFVKYKFFNYGMISLIPRMPIFLGIRDKDDMKGE